MEPLHDSDRTCRQCVSSGNVITCIGHEELEVYNGLPFRDEKNEPIVILKLMEEYCVGKTNTIYERYVFNNKH